MNHILITGITGFLGTEIAAQIMETTNDTIFGLIRADSKEAAISRLTALWQERPELKNEIGTRIIPVSGDVTEKNLGLSRKDGAMLLHETDIIIHTAAVIGIKHTRKEFWSVNVTGTKRVLALARRIQKDHPLKRFSHISTAYVAGKRSGRILEDSFTDAGFSSLYEQSKFEGEALVRAAGASFPVSIFRPGQIVGDSVTGRVKNFNTLYYPLKLYLKQQLSVFPIKPSLRVNMVPVDYVAKAVVRITYLEEGAGQTFHLTAPADRQPAVSELIDSVRAWAKEKLDLDLPKPVYVPAPFLDKLGADYNRSAHQADRKNILTNLLALAPYFSENKTFDTTNTERLLGVYDLDWQEYLPNLLQYAVDRSFLDHNSRTVFEQVRFCLEKQKPAVTYYDVTDDGTREMSAAGVDKRITRVLKSLQARGIGPGSRVALSGINSVAYFILDVAIGLSGAVSVPLYYTTPPKELDELLKKSGADVFFIGDARILNRVGEMDYDGQMISFTENADVPKDDRMLSWDDFLAQGKDREVRPVTVSYDDLATLRYTSGTTGTSKSVAFTHGQLRWMAQTMGSLLSFRSRSHPATYLSFLPLSHVVEGILGAYTPYYIGTPASIYFLNDFDKVAETLPKVRPTIFFSVPRFYEKVWDQLALNRVGRLYITTENERLKKGLRPILKQILLQRAGLDKCDQLIVGSAPVSRKLLSDFRELGIEIHNAYGLTEAPLITLNRLGANDLTTVGPPLPQTEVSLAEDGEILVKGPQVAAAYDGRADDVLHTGDLGEITESGHLRIIGRKKEILINSYGKNINLQKVETLLGDIPGISDTMLIGEQRPYCVALLWPDEDGQTPTRQELTAGVRAVNAQLSHPEQIKRFALMADPLKISTGELTPNLKLKRNNIEKIHAETIEGLYAPKAEAAGRIQYIGVL